MDLDEYGDDAAEDDEYANDDYEEKVINAPPAAAPAAEFEFQPRKSQPVMEKKLIIQDRHYEIFFKDTEQTTAAATRRG